MASNKLNELVSPTARKLNLRSPLYYKILNNIRCFSKYEYNWGGDNEIPPSHDVINKAIMILSLFDLNNDLPQNVDADPSGGIVFWFYDQNNNLIKSMDIKNHDLILRAHTN